MADPIDFEGREAPLIAVTTSEVRRAETLRPIKEGEPPQHEMALGLTYLRAIECAGGMPVVIPPLDDQAVGHLLERVDGLCLSGGPDLDPANYGEEPHEELGPTEPDLDCFELAIAREADRRGLPILAICRGMQALNVARGGSLVQHLPDLRDGGEGDLEHRQDAPGHQPTHPVRIEPDSMLAGLLGTDRIEVNSFHHQAIERLGRGLEVSARAPDGTIEGVEDPDRRFLVAVQWHAELLVNRAPERDLFESFVKASLERGRPTAVRRAA